MENSINVTITGDSTQLTKAVMDAERHLNGFRKTMDDVGKYVNSWTVKMQAVSMVFVGLRNAFQVTYAVVNNIAGSFMEFGGQLSKTSQRIGMSVESLGGLKYAAIASARFVMLFDFIIYGKYQLSSVPTQKIRERNSK